MCVWGGALRTLSLLADSDAREGRFGGRSEREREGARRREREGGVVGMLPSAHTYARARARAHTHTHTRARARLQFRHAVQVSAHNQRLAAAAAAAAAAGRRLRREGRDCAAEEGGLPSRVRKDISEIIQTHLSTDQISLDGEHATGHTVVGACLIIGHAMVWCGGTAEPPCHARAAVGTM